MKSINAKMTLKVFEDISDYQLSNMSNKTIFDMLKIKGYIYSTKEHKWVRTRNTSVNEWNQNRMGMYSK